MYHPSFRITPRLLRLISEATELKMWIHSSLLEVTWLPRLQRETLARLTHSSTAIEGNPLTLLQVEALIRGEEIGAEAKSKMEVLNYFSALLWISKKNKETFNQKDLLHLHKLVAKGLIEKPGTFKKKQNRVINSKGHTVYTPPSPTETPKLVRSLLEWLNSKESKELHPIIVGGVAHHRLVSIHPFSDGNGRVSRAFATWVLFVRGFDSHHIFSLDEYFERDREKYYLKIQQARDLDDDLTYWLEYVAEGVTETLKKTKERIASLQVSASSKIVLTQRQEDLLRFLRDKGRVRTSEIEKAFKLTRARVNQILKPLVDSGLVHRDGFTRATSYRLATLASG